MSRVLFFTFALTLIVQKDAARILAFFPLPAISHQLVLKPLTEALADHGHQVVFVTAFPSTKGRIHGNLREISVHNITNDYIKKSMMKKATETMDILSTMQDFYTSVPKLFEQQMESIELLNLIKNKSEHFDLVMIDYCYRSAFALSYRFNTPLIAISFVGSYVSVTSTLGAPFHFFLYPITLRERLYKLTIWEKINALYYEYSVHKIFKNTLKEYDDKIVQKMLGPEVPSIDEMMKNITLLFIGNHIIWESNRPIPPNIVYIGGIYAPPEHPLPEHLQSFLDSSTKDVIYVSFGSVINPLHLPQETIVIMIKVFSKMPFNILWKWDQGELPGRPENVRTYKWLPQADLLKHPKVKLFITHCGLRSTDDAIAAGVPLLGMPIAFDQYFNAENYVHHKIGLKIDVKHMDEDQFSEAIYSIMGDNSYKENILKLRAIINDQPMTPLDRAVWWTEHVLRHGGDHLRPPSAGISWMAYYECDLILTVLSIVSVVLLACCLTLYFGIRMIVNKIRCNRKIKLKIF